MANAESDFVQFEAQGLDEAKMVNLRQDRAE